MRQPKVAKKSAAQASAGAKFAAGGRAAQAAKRAAYAKAHHGAKLPRTKSQTQASLKWASAGRASQAARKQGKTPPKKAAVMAPPKLVSPRDLPGWSLGCNDWGPTCASAAVANHLLAHTGLAMTEQEVMLLHMLAGGDAGADIPSVLEALLSRPALAAGGRAGVTSFFRADEDLAVPGLIVVTALAHGRHAVLSHPLGMVSWGRVLPWEGEPLEAWAVEWSALRGNRRPS